MNPSLLSALASFEWALWRATWQASVLAGIVLVLQKMLARRIGGHGRYVLWIVVIVRLLLPVAPQSRWSVFNLTNRQEATFASRALRSTAAEINAKPPQAANRQIRILEDSPPIVRRIDWFTLAPQLLGAAWVCGVVILTANVIAACWWLRRVQRSLHVVTDPRIAAIIESSRQLLALRYTPRCLWGDSVRTPAVVGFFRPALWLPTQVLAQCDDEQIRLVILHELAHLKRNDVLGNWLIAAASIVHWFNPIVWLVAMRMRSDRELACDELVLSVSTMHDSQAYGRTLVRLVEILSTPRSIPPQPQVVGILESTGPMKRRVRMIARFNSASIHKSSRWFWTFALLLGLGCTTLTDAVRGDDAAKQQPQQQPSAQQKQTARPTAAVASSAEHPQDKAELEHLLQQVLPELRFDQVPFSDVVAFLRDTTGANMIVEWNELEKAALDKNTPVSLNLHRVVVEQALAHILRDAGGNVRLDYMIDRGAIVISTEDALATRSMTITYDVNDLMTTPTGEALSEVECQKRLGELTKLITTTIAPDSWRDAGGVTSSFSTFNTKLVIQSTPKIQQQIQRLLERLREQPTTQPRPLEP